MQNKKQTRNWLASWQKRQMLITQILKLKMMSIWRTRSILELVDKTHTVKSNGDVGDPEKHRSTLKIQQ